MVPSAGAHLENNRSSRSATPVANQPALLFAVRFNVVLYGVLRVIGGVNVVAVRQMRMVGCFFMITRFVMCSGFLVVARSVFQMLRCLLVVMSCFL
jgi:hypothetical protein